MQRLRAMAPALRIAASVVMLAWLATHVDLARLRLPAANATTVAWLVGAAAATFVGIVLSALRWQRVLAALGIDAAGRTLVRHYLASLFVGNFLPSTIGGDVLRVSRLSAENGKAPSTFASVVIERLTGWLVLPMLTIISLASNPGLRRAPGAREGRLALTIALATLALLVFVLATAASPRVGGRLNSNDGWRRFTGAVHLGIDRFRARPRLALEVLAAGFAYQLAVMLAAFMAARGLGVAISWTAILAFFPIVAIVQVLPVTVSGLGTREAALVFFLRPLGVHGADAVAFGLLVYLLNLGVSLLGAPAFALGRRPARVSA